MKKNTLLTLLLGLALAGLSACTPATASLPDPTALPATATLPPPPTETPLPASPTPLPALSADQLNNFTYFGPVLGITASLQNGKYQRSEGAVVEYMALLPDVMAFGDLNGDGLDDAVVVLAENGGGSGTFVSLVAMINQAGQPIQAGMTLVDDRPRINGLTIDAPGQVVLDAVIHSASDPMAAPTLDARQVFRWEAGELRLMRFGARTPAGVERVLSIHSPAWNDPANSALHVSGEMNIGPFENNLVYRLTDVNGEKLFEGPLTVQSDGLGGPATFDQTIALDISGLTPGSEVWFELSEVSMEDGSPMALARVRLFVP